MNNSNGANENPQNPDNLAGQAPVQDFQSTASAQPSDFDNYTSANQPQNLGPGGTELPNLNGLSQDSHGSPATSGAGAQYNVGSAQNTPGENNSSAKAKNMDTNGFLKAMLDLNFENFVTIKFAKIIYILMAVFIAASVAINTLIVFFSLATTERWLLAFLLSLLVLIVSIISGVISLIITRVLVEVAVALIRVAQNTTEIKHKIN